MALLEVTTEQQNLIHQILLIMINGTVCSYREELMEECLLRTRGSCIVNMITHLKKVYDDKKLIIKP